jgi:hypothetical protein
VIQVPQQLQVVTGEVAGTTSSASSVIGSSSGTLFSVVEGGRSFPSPVLAPLEQQIIVDPMLTSELRYGDLWSMREFNHFDFELNGIIRAFLRTAVNDFMDSVHHIWCPLSSQEYQDLPDGAETTLTLLPSPAFFQNSPAAVWRSDLARNRICAAGNAQRI